jgi:hypothetical protein
MYVAIGHVLIEIFKHVLAVWNTVRKFSLLIAGAHTAATVLSKEIYTPFGTADDHDHGIAEVIVN